MQLHFLAKAQLQSDTLKPQGEREPPKSLFRRFTNTQDLFGGGRAGYQAMLRDPWTTPGYIQLIFSAYANNLVIRPMK